MTDSTATYHVSFEDSGGGGDSTDHQRGQCDNGEGDKLQLCSGDVATSQDREDPDGAEERQALVTPDNISITNGGVINGDVILQHRPSVVKSGISHIDFWPNCKVDALQACDGIFEPFHILVQRANVWISQFFKDFEIVACETVDKKVIYVKDIHSASMYFQDEDGPVLATHIKGLRIWYTPRTSESELPETVILSYFDTMPYYLNPGEKHPKFESRDHTIERVNGRLRESPLPGKILSVETVIMQIAKEDWSSNINLTALQEQTQWFDEYNVHQLNFIRVFYVKCRPPIFETIGIKDFAPDAIDEGGIFHPAKYQSFTTLVRRATQWISKATGIRVTNIQTLDAKHRKRCENEGKRFNTNKMFEYRIEERFRGYFLRVGYTQTLDRSMDPLINTLPKVVCRTFIPFKRDDEDQSYENVAEIIERIGRDLKTTGCAVFHVETVPLPEWITNPDMCERGERTFFDGEWYFNQDKDGNDIGPYRYTLVYAVRVYFDAPASHPLLGQRRMSIYPSSDNSCCILL